MCRGWKWVSVAGKTQEDARHGPRAHENLLTEPRIDARTCTDIHASEAELGRGKGS